MEEGDRRRKRSRDRWIGIIGRHWRVERDVKKWRQRAREICHKMIINTIDSNRKTNQNNYYNDLNRYNNDIQNNYNNNDNYDDIRNNR